MLAAPRCLDFIMMNASHSLSKSLMLTAKLTHKNMKTYTHCHLVGASSPQCDTLKMGMKGEVLIFVGPNHLLQSKHRLSLVNPSQAPCPQLVQPWSSHRVQDQESKIKTI